MGSKARVLSRKISVAAGAAAILTFSLLYSQNNIFSNAHWDSSYALDGGIRSAGLESVLSRQAISHNRLNSGNHGFRQKVISRKAYDWKKISLTASMNPFSYFDLRIHSAGEVRGIRISSHELLPSMEYREDKPDSFLKTISFPYRASGKDLDLVLERDGDVFIDGNKVHGMSTPLSPGKIEILVSHSSVRNVSVNLPEKETLPFLRTDSFWKYFGLHFVALSLVSVLLPIQVPLFIFLLGILWSAYDYSTYSGKSFKLNQRSLEYKSPTPVSIDFENLRHKFFKSWFHLVGGVTPDRDLLESRYGLSSPSGAPLLCKESGCSFVSYPEIEGEGKKEFRIFILGGSLTDGWGVARPEEAIYPLYIQKNLSEKKPVSVLTSISPFINEYRHLDLGKYRATLKAFRPDLILLDIGPRFTNPDEFSAFLQEMKKDKIPLLSFLAPVDVLGAAPHYLIKAKAGKAEVTPEDPVSSLIRAAGVTLINPQTHFLNPELYLKNDLFVDHSHLTGVGHRELGRVLADEIREMTERK